MSEIPGLVFPTNRAIRDHLADLSAIESIEVIIEMAVFSAGLSRELNLILCFFCIINLFDIKLIYCISHKKQKIIVDWKISRAWKK